MWVVSAFFTYEFLLRTYIRPVEKLSQTAGLLHSRAATGARLGKQNKIT